MRHPAAQPRRWLAAAIAVAALSLASHAAAQAPSSGDPQLARRTAAEATEQYNLGHFEDALAAYEEAYEQFPAPQLLFNIGQCHRELGDPERVVFFFDRYLEELPDAPNRALVEDLLTEARPAAARQLEAAAAAEALRLEQSQLARAQQVAEHDAAQLEAERARLALEQAQAQRAVAAEPELYEQWWLWAIVGVVVVGVALGVGLGEGLSPEPQLPMGSLGTVDTR